MTQQEYENKIKELQDELEQLKAAKIEVEQPKRWQLNEHEDYFFIGIGGVICSTIWVGRSNDADNWCYLTGNCFKTKKEAEEYKKQIEYTARYKNYIEEHSEPIDWENDKQCKYLVEFSYNGHIIKVSDYYALKKQGAIYASSLEIIWEAIKEIGEDNFKKYVLGVE